MTGGARDKRLASHPPKAPLTTRGFMFYGQRPAQRPRLRVSRVAPGRRPEAPPQRARATGRLVGWDWGFPPRGPPRRAPLPFVP